MFNSVKQLLTPVLSLAEHVTANNVIQQQVRTTVILKRHFPYPLFKKGSKFRKITNKNYIYKVVKRTEDTPSPKLNLILTEAVEGYGEKGDQIQVKQHFGYNRFLLPKKAVYASPENLEKYASFVGTTKKHSSLIAPKNAKHLRNIRLGVGMSSKNLWTIEKWHIKVALRVTGVTVSEDAIELPDKEISGPNLELEGKEFYVTITINNHEKVNMRCVLYHHFPPNESPFPENYWQYPNDAMFPEWQSILDDLPKKFPLMNETRPNFILKKSV